MALLIRLEQSKFNDERNGQRWHARAVSTGETTTDQLADAIQEATTFTKGEVVGLISELVMQMTAEMQQGKTVVLDGLGRFRLAVESESVEKAKDFSLKKHIKRIKCRFVPAGKLDPDARKKSDNFAVGIDLQWYKGRKSEELKDK